MYKIGVVLVRSVYFFLYLFGLNDTALTSSYLGKIPILAVLRLKSLYNPAEIIGKGDT